MHATVVSGPSSIIPLPFPPGSSSRRQGHACQGLESATAALRSMACKFPLILVSSCTDQITPRMPRAKGRRTAIGEGSSRYQRGLMRTVTARNDPESPKGVSDFSFFALSNSSLTTAPTAGVITDAGLGDT
ncbi:hypothetical protein A6A29_40985 [Streptomyces sp. TSRI0281]|nr:hypothetical protein A6A29_40985 [Streptomyces sp. TSRI0281]